MKKLILKIIIVLVVANFAALAYDFPDATEIHNIAKKLDLQKYPDADSILISDVQNIKYNKDGTGENTDDVYIMIVTEKGKDENRTINFHFNCYYQKIEILFAELIKSDSSTVNIDITSNSRISVNHNQMSSNIYDPNQKVMTLNIPGLEIGDIIHYRFKETIIKTRMPNTWSELIVLQYDQPIIDYKIEVISPPELPLAKIAIKNEVPGTVTYKKIKENELNIHRWEVKNVPQVFPEPDMPPLYTQVQRLLLGTISNWEEISQWYWQLCFPHLQKINSAMEDEVKKLCENKDGDLEKIRAIFDFVSQKVRYMGITTENEAPGYEPHDVSITFDKRYGVCRDKAALLTAMLRIAGFDAFPVLIMAGPKKDADVPNPYFNHAITCVQMKKEEYLLMDATNETQKEFLPAYLSDKSFLVAKPEGEKLKVSPIIPVEKNMLLIRTNCEIRNDKSAIAQSEIKFSGINDSAYRGAFLRRSKEQVYDFLETILKRPGNNYKLESFEIFPQNLSDMSEELTLKMTYQIPDVYVSGNSSSIFLPPVLSNLFGMANFLIDKMGLEKRNFPLFTEIACGVNENIEISGVKNIESGIIFPEKREIETPIFSWLQEYKKFEDKINYESSFLLKSVEYSPADYQDLKKTLGIRQSDLLAFPIIEQTVKKEKKKEKISESGIRINSEEIEIEISDNNSWRETRIVSAELLDFSGKRDISEVKFHFNEGIEDIKVDYARVIAPDGKIKEIRNEEINLMDQGWSSTAPRYPPGKILVLSLPGVDIGSKIEFKSTSNKFRRPFFEYFNSLRTFYKILEKKITIKNPKRLKLKFAERSEGELKEGTFKEESFSRIYKNLEPLKKERDIPPAWAEGDFLLISSGDWQSYYDEIRKKIKNPDYRNSQKLKELSERLKNKYGKNKEELCKGIRDFITINIRMTGPAFFELPWGFNPDPEKVLSESYGNSFEIASLFSALLYMADIENEPVLCSDFPFIKDKLKIVEKCPISSLFNTLLIKVSDKEKIIYLNDTEQYAELGEVRNEGNTAYSGDETFFKIEPESLFKSGIKSTYFIKILGDSSAEMKIRHEFFGKKYSEMRKTITEMTPEYLRRFFQEKASEIMLSARILQTPESDFSSYPGKITFIVKCPNFAKIAENSLSFSVPNRVEAFENLLVSRSNPFLFKGSDFISTEFFISVPDDFKIYDILPPKDYYAEFSSGNYMRISTELKKSYFNQDKFLEGNELIFVKYYVNFSGAIFSEYEYQDLLEKTLEFNSKAYSMFLLRKK
ncbi:MAG TPA: DUF3857 domain-containing protein [Victivallales bacterium]|nr:DUF3857 domain-containing protein [Victivallales bacterium]HRR27949.1 DUF3857 domain-containing protein [Victivallales bacterium]